MMKKNWKNRSAVSPVIATILMVAITVVLAAVLYVMVMGFGNSGASSNPTSSMTSTATNTAHTEQVKIASISTSQLFTNLKISIQNNTAGAITTYIGTWTGAASTLSVSSLPTGVTVSYVCLSGNSATQMGSGDYMLIRAGAGATYTISLLYGSSSASIGSTSYTTF